MDLGAKEVPKLLVAMIEVNSWVLFFPLLVSNYDEMSVLFHYHYYNNNNNNN